jgi:hypothetical protein
VEIGIITSLPIEFTLMLRIPGWTLDEAFVSDLYYFKDKQGEKPLLYIENKPEPIIIENGYARITRTWKGDEKVILDLPMSPRKVYTNHQVLENEGLIALQRGPLVYCLETDSIMHDLDRISINDENISFEYRNRLLEGIVVLKGSDFTAIPYYSWANRGPSKMAVWNPWKTE